MVKHRRLVASDTAPTRNDDKALGNVAESGMSFLSSIGTPAKLERFWAEAWIRRNIEDPDEVLAMLGLVEVEKRTEEESEPVSRSVIAAAVDHPERQVRCPTCHAIPGAACSTYNGSRNQIYQRGHVERHRRARERS